jgi:hypothetical protein
MPGKHYGTCNSDVGNAYEIEMKTRSSASMVATVAYAAPAAVE